MKFELPTDHGLSESQQRHLLFRDETGQPALSDVQFEALNAGVGRGESVLIVSPTSTGKTQIALWAIASSLEQGHNTVYLVTHRALAKQKFEDFKSQLLISFLGGNASSLVGVDPLSWTGTGLILKPFRVLPRHARRPRRQHQTRLRCSFQSSGVRGSPGRCGGAGGCTSLQSM